MYIGVYCCAFHDVPNSDFVPLSLFVYSMVTCKVGYMPIRVQVYTAKECKEINLSCPGPDVGIYHESSTLRLTGDVYVGICQ